MRIIGALLATIFLGVFIAIGIGVAFHEVVQPWWQARPYRDWVHVPCVITVSTLQAGGPEAPPALDLRFSYTWQGGVREGRRLRPGDAPLSSQEMADAAHRHATGSQTTCAFPAGDPDAAALEVPKSPAIDAVAFMAIWASFFTGIPLVMLIAIWRRALRPAPAGSGPRPPASTRWRKRDTKFSYTVTDFSKPSAPRAVGDSWQLRPASGRIPTAIGIGIFALFWNGITWMAMITLWREESGITAVGVTLFLLLFVAIGLLIAGLFVHVLLKALLTPQLELTLASEHLTSGRSTALRWTIVRGRERLQDLRIELVLREECRYRRGTDTLTDRHEVRAIEAWHRTEPDQEGRCTLLPPAELPPTFRRPGNQLAWCIRLRGTVAGLPDVDDEYPVEVHAVGGIGALAAGVVDLPADDAGPGVHLTLESATLVPGVPIRGRVDWNLTTLPTRGELRLGWRIAGKGDQDQEIVFRLPLPIEALVGAYGFQLTAPAVPPTWPGTVVSVRWLLEATLDDVSAAEREVTIGHPAVDRPT